MFKIGNDTIAGFYVGDAEVTKIYQGNETYYEPESADTGTSNRTLYLTILTFDEETIVGSEGSEAELTNIFRAYHHGNFNSEEVPELFTAVDIFNTAYTGSYDSDNGYFVITGPFELNTTYTLTIIYNDGSFCTGVEERELVFTGDTAEMDCTDIEITCEEPEDTCADYESLGYGSWEECRCAEYGDNCEE